MIEDLKDPKGGIQWDQSRNHDWELTRTGPLTSSLFMCATVRTPVERSFLDSKAPIVTHRAGCNFRTSIYYTQVKDPMSSG